MSDQYRVYPPDLTAHAGTLDGLAERIATVHGAAAGTDLGIDSFGIIGQFFAIGARVESGRATECIEALREATSCAGTGVRQTGDTYQQVDDANCAIFDGER